MLVTLHAAWRIKVCENDMLLLTSGGGMSDDEDTVSRLSWKPQPLLFRLDLVQYQLRKSDTSMHCQVPNVFANVLVSSGFD